MTTQKRPEYVCKTERCGIQNMLYLNNEEEKVKLVVEEKDSIVKWRVIII